MKLVCPGENPSDDSLSSDGNWTDTPSEEDDDEDNEDDGAATTATSTATA